MSNLKTIAVHVTPVLNAEGGVIRLPNEGWQEVLAESRESAVELACNLESFKIGEPHIPQFAFVCTRLMKNGSRVVMQYRIDPCEDSK